MKEKILDTVNLVFTIVGVLGIAVFLIFLTEK